MNEVASQRFMPPAARKLEPRVAKSLGMDGDAREALTRIKELAKSRKIAVAGTFMPDSGVSAALAGLGIQENVEETDFFRFDRVVIPFSGIAQRLRKEWEERGIRLEDLSSPQVRRAQVALGLLRMEGAQALVIGRHEDAETQAIAGGNTGTRIIEDTTDTARLEFSPKFGAVCQTNQSPRRVAWLVQQLRHRYRDSRVTFLETITPAMAAREDALERLLVDCDQAIVVGDPGESSCQALVESALRCGKAAVIIRNRDELEREELTSQKIALSAGAFATDEAIRGVAGALLG